MVKKLVLLTITIIIIFILVVNVYAEFEWIDIEKVRECPYKLRYINNVGDYYQLHSDVPFRIMEDDMGTIYEGNTKCIYLFRELEGGEYYDFGDKRSHKIDRNPESITDATFDILFENGDVFFSPPKPLVSLAEEIPAVVLGQTLQILPIGFGILCLILSVRFLPRLYRHLKI